MNTKKTLVSFLLVASVLLLASAVSAATSIVDPATAPVIKINDVNVPLGTPVGGVYPIAATYTPISVQGGDTLTVQVQFTAANGSVITLNSDTNLNSTSNVKVRAELSGQNIDVIATSPSFDVLAGNTYTQTLSFKVPTDLSQDLTDKSLTLSLKISNSDFDTEINDISMLLQRASYDAAIKSVMVDNTVSAGETFPVDVVLKNVGFNQLSDMYVTLNIPELNIQKSAYFGDLVALTPSDNNDNTQNTVSGRLYITLPYSVQAGNYNMQVTAQNDQVSQTVTQPLTVTNSLTSLAFQSGTNSLTLLNPTSQLQVYTVKYLDQTVSVVMSAASSKDVTLTLPTGSYNFDATVYSGNQLLSTVNFTGTGSQTASTTTLTSPVLVLTVILAIVFVVLLVVLIVLLTRRPQKSEEFGESYY